MWHTRAVLSMLIRDVAELRRPPADPGDAAGFAAALSDARRRALRVVLLDWTAIVVLLLLRDTEGLFPTLGPTPETVLTLGLLAIAAHSGFRLGQLQKYSAVGRAGSELAERDAGRHDGET